MHITHDCFQIQHQTLKLYRIHILEPFSIEDIQEEQLQDFGEVGEEEEEEVFYDDTGKIAHYSWLLTSYSTPNQ